MNNNFDGEELGFWDQHAKDSAASLSQPVYSVQVKRDVPIVMSDGTRLYCDIFTPDTAEGTNFPVLLGYSPFGKEAQYVGRLRDPIKLGNLMYEQGIEVGGIDYFVSRGYIVVVANPRGILNSEGCWTGISVNRTKTTAAISLGGPATTFPTGMLG